MMFLIAESERPTIAVKGTIKDKDPFNFIFAHVGALKILYIVGGADDRIRDV